jgi:hypothetical protein
MGLHRPLVASDAKFSLSGLLPGRYSIVARASSQANVPSAPGSARPTGPVVSDLWAETKLTVAGSDLTNVSLVLRPGMAVAGRVQFETTSAARPEMTRVSVNFSPPPTSGVTLGVPAVQAQADGTFSTKGVAPGRYFVSATAPGSSGTAPTWFLESVTAGGRDVLDTPLEIEAQRDVTDVVVTFSDRVTELTGQIVDSAGQPVPQYYVGVFPVNQSQWRRGSRWLRVPTRPGTDGRFRMAGLPPGEYFLAALSQFDQSEWFTPAFLEQVAPGAIRVTLAKGEKKVQDVKLR